MHIESFIDKKLEDVFCPTCGDAGNKLVHKYMSIGFYKCNECHIEYASPRLSETDMLNLYQGDGWRNAKDFEKWTYQNWLEKKDKTFYLVNENLNLVSRFLPQGSSLLDVGSDIGLSVRHLNENNFFAEGVEVSEVASEIANTFTQAPTTNSNLKQFKNDKMYDGLLLRAVLEHLYDPIDVLKDCAKVIRKDGLIFIDVPHYKGLSTRYKKFLHRLGVKKNYKHFGFPAHLYAFDKRSLSYMLNKAGFEVVHFESWPKALTTGKVNSLNAWWVGYQKKNCLTDYINVVARKS